MKIKALVTNNNTMIIDPTVCINADAINSYEIEFIFQQPWDNTLTLYAIFKPKLDTPIYIALDDKNKCIIPSLMYHRFSKVGIGLKGQTTEEGVVTRQEITNLYYIPVRKSAGNFMEDLI